VLPFTVFLLLSGTFLLSLSESIVHYAPSRSKQKIAQLKAKNTAKAIFRTCLNAYFRLSKRALPHWPISYCATMCTCHKVFFHGVAHR